MVKNTCLWTSCCLLQWAELCRYMDSLVICVAALSFSYMLRFRKILIKWLNQAYGCFNLIHKVAANIQYAVLSRGERGRRSKETPLEKIPENWETCAEQVSQIGWSSLHTTSRSRYCTKDAHLPHCAPKSQSSLPFLWHNEKVIVKPAWQQKDFHLKKKSFFFEPSLYQSQN